MPFVSYATKEEVSTYSGIATDSLPANVEVLIMRASELITIMTFNNINMSNETHVALVRLATCAQVQVWIERGLSAVSDGNVTSYSLGDLSMQFANTDITQNKLCTMAQFYLKRGYLFYRGLG